MTADCAASCPAIPVERERISAVSGSGGRNSGMAGRNSGTAPHRRVMVLRMERSERVRCRTFYLETACPHQCPPRNPRPVSATRPHCASRATAEGWQRRFRHTAPHLEGRLGGASGAALSLAPSCEWCEARLRCAARTPVCVKPQALAHAPGEFGRIEKGRAVIGFLVHHDVLFGYECRIEWY